MIAIHPQYLTLSKLLDGRLFRIPDYQRAYSWTSRQRNDLFEDIDRVFRKGPDEGHFMAAVVGLRRVKQTLGTDEYHVIEVVDGQQRLTTLIILFKAIQLALNVENRAEEKLARELAELLVKAEADEPILLQTNHDGSQHFASFLRKGTSLPAAQARSIADQELLLAIEECQAFVDRWKGDGNDLPSLAALLKNRLFFLLHEIDDEKSVYTVFEVLNSRGLDVSWLDRLKSLLMGAAFELKGANQKGLIDELHDAWRKIYAVIGLRQGMNTEALRFAATLSSAELPNRPLSERDSVECLKNHAEGGPQKIREIANWLLQVTEACDSVTGNRRVNAVTRISQARLLATAIHLRKDLTETDRKALLSRWEKVSFRIYGLFGNDARTSVGDYIRLAWRVVKQKLPPKEIDTEMKALGESYAIKDYFADFRGDNFYEGWEAELRYLMYRYEEHLARKRNQNFSNEQWERIWLASPSDSVEHIWPASKAPDKVKHCLGNLILLPPGLNSSLQDKPPKEKVSAYRKTGLLIAGEVADMIEEHGWNKKMVDARESALWEWASREWDD